MCKTVGYAPTSNEINRDDHERHNTVNLEKCTVHFDLCSCCVHGVSIICISQENAYYGSTMYIQY